MPPDDFFYWVNNKPFIPFQIRLNSGRTLDIRHPEMVKVGRSSVNVYTYRGNPSEEPYQHLEMISLVLVESIQAIPSSNAA